VTNKATASDAARLFAQSLPPAKHLESQEALRFARWFGEERAIADIRPADIENYVETFGASSPNAGSRADALKGFLAFNHKQGLMPERLVSHVRVRRPQSRSKAAAKGMAATPEVRLTPSGHEALLAELESLKDQRPRITEDLQAAMADKDFRENAPLDAAREAQGQLEARIRDLEGMLRHAIIEENEVTRAGDAAHVGSNVVLLNVATGSRLTYQIVNAAEARAGTGRLSIESPVGQAVVGHREGDEVEVSAPSGKIRFRIEGIQS
jgi:transcription elongation factor GreA